MKLSGAWRSIICLCTVLIRARVVGDEQFFVNWHEPDAHGFVTLHIDFKAEHVHGSVLAAYATDEEQILFHKASIDRVELPGRQRAP